MSTSTKKTGTIIPGKRRVSSNSYVGIGIMFRCIVLLRRAQSCFRIGCRASSKRPLLPTRFGDPRNLTRQSQLTKTDATHAKTSHIGSWSATSMTAIIASHLEFRRSVGFYNQRFLGHTPLLFYSPLKGIPRFLSSSKPSSSVFAVVTRVTSIPWILSILSKSISGNIICS